MWKICCGELQNLATSPWNLENLNSCGPYSFA